MRNAIENVARVGRRIGFYGLGVEDWLFFFPAPERRQDGANCGEAGSAVAVRFSLHHSEGERSRARKIRSRPLG